MQTMLEEVEATKRSLLPIAESGDAILFGRFRLVPTARTRTRDGETVHIGDRAHDIFEHAVAVAQHSP
jgi:hypothetical protein